MDGWESSELADEGLALLLSSSAFCCSLTLEVGIVALGLEDWADMELLLDAEFGRSLRKSIRSFGKIVLD